jgi:hypothetical protein
MFHVLFFGQNCTCCWEGAYEVQSRTLFTHLLLLIRLTKRSLKVACGGHKGHYEVNFFLANQKSMIVSLRIDGVFQL